MGVHNIKRTVHGGQWLVSLCWTPTLDKPPLHKTLDCRLPQGNCTHWLLSGNSYVLASSGRVMQTDSFSSSLPVLPVPLHSFLNFSTCGLCPSLGTIWKSMVCVSGCWATSICCHLTFSSLLPKLWSQPRHTISMCFIHLYLCFYDPHH